jgi:hypothetical protein
VSVAPGHDGGETIMKLKINDWLRLIAGAFVMLSVALGYYVSPWYFLFTAFVGLNLFQSGLTGWCPMVAILRQAGVEEG